ncbi:MAG: YbfB/YjiJ family MFS transporter, partial [Alphaproteobacteria bacterium]|nr:YbfB/YjiJ family MFS transporter [Alphaproteobacteria bacterium]
RFAPADAAYLGAANFAGYLLGAAGGRWLAMRLPVAAVLRAMLLLAAASFVASAWPLSFLWFFLWRFAAGVAGGSLMVLGPTLALSQVPTARRGVAGGIVFTGVGLGIVASGTLVPLLIDTGLRETWIALGLLSLLLTAAAWNGWPTAAAPVPLAAAPGPTRGLRTFYVEYGLTAVALVPHMVFLVDFIARGLGQGLDIGGRYWAVFGIGAALGPLLSGWLADRIGFGPALRLALAVETALIALPAFAQSEIALLASSLVVGAFVPGCAALALGRVHELVPGAQRPRAWSVCTIAFAVGQAGGAYALSFLYAAYNSHALLFLLGSAVLAAALLLDLTSAVRRRDVVSALP